MPSGQSTKPIADSTAHPAVNQLKQVFNEIWAVVYRIIDELRRNILKELSDIDIDIQRQERNVGYLLELDVKEDPVLVYLNCCVKHMENVASTLLINCIIATEGKSALGFQYRQKSIIRSEY